MDDNDEDVIARPWWQTVAIGASLLVIACPLLGAYLVPSYGTARSDTLTAVTGGCLVGALTGALYVRRIMTRLRHEGRRQHPSIVALTLAGVGIGSLLRFAPGVAGPAIAMALLGFLSGVLLTAGFADRANQVKGASARSAEGAS